MWSIGNGQLTHCWLECSVAAVAAAAAAATVAAVAAAAAATVAAAAAACCPPPPHTPAHTRGHRYGLCGGNGVGKSTLLRAISKGQLEGFPPPEKLKTVYVEHDIQVSVALYLCA
jgi:hypothetical protein